MIPNQVSFSYNILNYDVTIQENLWYQHQNYSLFDIGKFIVDRNNQVNSLGMLM